MATQAAAAAASANSNNSNDQSGSPMMMLSLVDVEDEHVLQRLTWIKYPVESRPDNTTTKKRDLYWPALYYKSHREAADLGNHQNFQHMLAEPLLEMLLADDDEPAAADPGPVCRLLGFQDGTYMTLGHKHDGAMDGDSNNNNSKTVPFVANMAKCFVHKSKKEKYFSMDLPEERELFDLYQAAVWEAKTLLKDGNKSKRRLVGNHQNTDNTKKFKPSNENNDNGGSHAPDGGEDKPDAAGRVTFQNLRPALAPLQQHQAEAQPQQQVAASTATPSTPTGSSSKKKKKKEPPATPPFQARSDIHNVSAGEPWKNIWFKMRCSGWVRRNARINENNDEKVIWMKPGCDPVKGVEGVDYFTSELGCQGYVHSKIPHWRPPAWDIHGAAEGPPILAPAPANQHRRNHNNNNRRGMSSSATVITTDSSPGRSQPPPARSVRRCAASQQTSKYTAQTSLVAYKVKEQLWWRKNKVPTLSRVKPILHKLGIRRNESGSYVLPDAVTMGSGSSDSSSPPDLTDADMLRKYLCTKGVPTVPADKDADEECQLTEEEQDVLHQWVSFAYVPVQDLEESLTTITLPPQKKILHLLAKFKFQMSDEKYFVPLVDKSGVRGYARVEGVHFFRGLSQVRDYIRRTASFSWTEDDFDESDNSEDGIHEDDFPQEKALLRLWAASSPSPLSAYETSLAHLEKMESMLPQEDNEFESDESEVEEEESDDESISVSSEEASEEEEEVESEEEEQSMESEEESVRSGSTGRSNNSSADDDVLRDSMAGKRKAESAKLQKKISAKKQKSLPWWQTESFPSEDTMKPILSKLGIFKQQNKGFVIPGKDTATSLKTLESVRKFLCVNGLPVHTIHKPSLNASEKELLRRWVSFAHVPVTQKQCLKKVTSILPLYEKHFAQGIETQFFDILSKVRFQKDSNGQGYYPPGIDSLGRDKETRKANLKKDISEVREYIRCSERLTLDDKDGAIVDDSELRIDSERLLALRLWGALEPSTLRSYNVDPSHVVVIAPAPTAKERRTMKKGNIVQELEPLEYPSWWKEASLQDIQDQIEVLRNAEEATERKAGSRLPRRPQTSAPKMTIEQLEIAYSVRMRIESNVRRSLSSNKPKTIDGIILDFIEEFGKDITLYQIEKFLAGDNLHLVKNCDHEKIEGHFKDWLEYQETGVKRTQPKEIEEQYSNPTPPSKSAAPEEDTPKECVPSSNSPKETGRGQSGSLVLNVSDLRQPSPPGGVETKDFSSPISTFKTTRATGSGNSSHSHSSAPEAERKHLQPGARKSLVSDLEDTSMSQEITLYQSDKKGDLNRKGKKDENASNTNGAAMKDGEGNDLVQQNAEDEKAAVIESQQQKSESEGDNHEGLEPHKLLLTQAEDQEVSSVASAAARDHGGAIDEASDHEEESFIIMEAPQAEVHVHSPENFSPVQTQDGPHELLQLETAGFHAPVENPGSRRVTSEAPNDFFTQPGEDYASDCENEGHGSYFC